MIIQQHVLVNVSIEQFHSFRLYVIQLYSLPVDGAL